MWFFVLCKFIYVFINLKAQVSFVSSLFALLLKKHTRLVEQISEAAVSQNTSATSDSGDQSSDTEQEDFVSTVNSVIFISECFLLMHELEP